MTGEQRTTVGLIKSYGYHVINIRRAQFGIALVTVRRKLTTGTLTLRVRPDGTYVAPEYDTRNPGRKAA